MCSLWHHVLIEMGKSQSSWFVVTGKDFVIDAHNTGGIDGNGQVAINQFWVANS